MVRPLQLEDAEAWASYVCLPEVMEHTSSTATTVADVRDEIRRTLAVEESSPIRFALVPDGSEAIVATVGFHAISTIHRTAEVAYDVAPSWWGKGIASAACHAATLWAFENKGWHRIQATTVLSNIRSQRVIERCGFKREGILRNFRIIGGSPADYLVYSIIPGEIHKERG